jgi:tRNA U34 5-carboxymethylaminomethyl modifying enzyme MnmG/GidA
MNALQAVREGAGRASPRPSLRGRHDRRLVTLGTESRIACLHLARRAPPAPGCDSVYERLAPVAVRLGVLDDERKRRIEARVTRMRRAAEAAEADLRPDKETIAWLREADIELTTQTTVAKLVQRPTIDIAKLSKRLEHTPELSEAFRALTEEETGSVRRLRYASIERQQREAGSSSRTKTSASRRA